MILKSRYGSVRALLPSLKRGMFSNLRRGHVKIAVWSPAHRVGPEQTLRILNHGRDLFRLRIKMRDRAVFDIGQVNAVVRRFEHAVGRGRLAHVFDLRFQFARLHLLVFQVVAL